MSTEKCGTLAAALALPPGVLAYASNCDAAENAARDQLRLTLAMKLWADRQQRTLNSSESSKNIYLESARVASAQSTHHWLANTQSGSNHGATCPGKTSSYFQVPEN